MTKKRVNITVNPEVHEKAKQFGLNVSKVAENALRLVLGRLEKGSDEKAGPPFPDSELDTEASSRTAGKSTEEVLKDYRDFARIALNRSEPTVNQHTRYISRLLEQTGKSPGRIKEDDIVEYLSLEKPMSRSKHQNVVSALRVFFREYLESDLAESFKIPTVGPNPTKVPSKEELQSFYQHLNTARYKAMFLTYATSGLRSSELRELQMENVDLERRMLTPDKRSRTKKTWVSFYNFEAERVLNDFLPHREQGDDRLFQVSKNELNQAFGKASEESGVKITAPKLRKWFASEMATLGVDSTYIDAFCGRTPDTVLEKHYLDFSPRRLEEIYREAGITVLE
ncbi:tyrosine-type recombinase/integrase [Candidatus Bipolaricaulota bacterium]|nr:tyrosine-type recombinase/integrase [Candidatus Bipolaricaulota bacterium]MBS3792407.1 tyrosine-type recombinase/integrase [Candidatus Bipolaricaulota bacterium]MBS3813014.1 tyrosine-type recombinase/integrase [Candidatus Bipolaricaulota bacterium]